MADEKDLPGSGTDLIGIKPLAKSIEIATQGAVDMTTALIERICFPAAKELGLVLKEKVHAYRAKNITAMVQKADEKMNANNVTTEMHADPRIVNLIIANSSWIEDSAVQDMWAGLLSSACTDSGDDDSNLIFTNLLSALTKLQARILAHVCETAKKTNVNGLIFADRVFMPLKAIIEKLGEDDINRLDREIDHLRETGLLVTNSGFNPHRYTPQSLPEMAVDLTPSSLALHMYVRCQGSRKTPVEFFGIAEPISKDA